MKFNIKNFFKWNLSDIEDDVLLKNEVLSNRTLAFTLLALSFIDIGIFILRGFQVIWYTREPLDYVLTGTLLASFIPFVLCFIFKGRKNWLKYVMVSCLFISSTTLFLFLGLFSSLLMIVPVAFASRYYHRKLNVVVSIAGFIALVLVTLFGPLVTEEYEYSLLTRSQILEIIFYNDLDYSIYLKTISSGALISVSIIYLLLAYLLTHISWNGKKMLMDQKANIEKEAKAEGELELARNIQGNMLPKGLDEEIKNNCFDVVAFMNPAKEVGGDFYDYFMIDETHICVLIADVSGKGVPAGIFMAEAKTLIKSSMLEHSISDVFEIVNNLLCEGNDDGLFITAWLGVLSLDNGELIYTNAGHCNPFIKSKNEVIKLKQKPNFVLGGVKDIQYESFKYQMKEDDILLLYTDGVTEAMNVDKKLFGEDRLVEFLSSYSGEFTNIIESLKERVDKYSEGLQQSDDITCLGLVFKKAIKNIIYNEFIAATNNIQEVLNFTISSMEKLKVKEDISTKVKIIVEEVYMNIASYAYKYKTGKAYIGFKLVDDELQITFKDQGSPFNPLKYDSPDIDQDSDERKVGGLGIHMVINMSDDIKYRYDGSNILTVIKKLR